MSDLNDFSDYVLFVKVVDHQGFSAAGRQLGIPKSRLSRRIALLEERLGVRLLQRNSRSLTVTSVGRLFYERCQAMVALGEAARDVVRQVVAQPQGMLRLSCPVSLTQTWLRPLLPGFLEAYPAIKLTLSATNRRVDPIEENIDVALRVRRPPFEDSNLVVKRLGESRDVLIASPALLACQPALLEPQELAQWPTLALPSGSDRHVWQLVNEKQTIEIMHDPRFISADMYALKQAALAGLGVTLLPKAVCRDELRDGLLQQVLPQWHCPPSEIQAVFPTRRGMVPAVRALIDYLAEHRPDSV
jgi:DNA-binding transcriptional LysR family regulator